MTTTHRIGTGVVLALALAAASAPGASARPVGADPSATGANPPPAAVYSRPDKSVIPVSPPATSGAALSAYRQGQLATALDVAATAANQASAPQAVVRVQTPQSGFDWGDAGIGAAGGIAFSMMALGAALGVSQRRARRTRQTTAAVTG